MAAPYAIPLDKEPVDVLNFCTKYLARGVKLFNDQASANAGNLSIVSEPWRFPLVQPASFDGAASSLSNEVTFIYFARNDQAINSIEVVGSFAPLYVSLPLAEIIYDGVNTGYYYLSLIVPSGKGYYYRFRINGEDVLDPVNPQRKIFRNGKEWSFFFTDYYNYSQDFEEWEINILYRLVQQIVPFRTAEAQNFINRFYLTMARPGKDAMPIYKLDESVGEVNYITNVLAREERHHLIDYKICIHLIDQLLRSRNPVVDSWLVPEEMINDLYNEMASGDVPGWDKNSYGNPQYFLRLLRRHTITGAFSHPKYGGNIGGAGWKYLQEKYSIKDDSAQVTGSYFNWQLSQEKPLGTNADYRG